MSIIEEPGFLSRARRRLSRTGDAAMRRFVHRHSPDLPERESQRLADEIRACASPTAGEMTARRRTAEIGEHYRILDETGRRRFFGLLAEEFGVEQRRVDQAVADRAAALATDPVDDRGRFEAERALRSALISPREVLFRRFNGMDDGVKFIVDLRSDLRALRNDDPAWRHMDAELRDLLTGWFDVGNLELRRISWDTPASLLERLVAYEAVHEIASWQDLRNRLDSDRRCYAFFHPGMPDEPLIFVEIALTKGIAGNLQQLLDLDAPSLDPLEADTAIFYSISNCQTGLAGVNLGDLLIKQVVTALVTELPNLSAFSTLSPIPGFRDWLTTHLESSEDLFTAEEHEQIRPVLGADVSTALLSTLADQNWPTDGRVTAALEAPLLRLCASYLTKEKRVYRAADRVANFHLSNGSRIERLNWLANTSDAGLERSAGIMVNYRYVPEHISDNHDAYVTRGEIHVTQAIRDVLNPAD